LNSMKPPVLKNGAVIEEGRRCGGRCGARIEKISSQAQ